MAGYGIGASLAGVGAQQQQDATQALGDVARQEQERNQFNVAQRQQAKAGNAQLGATAGALYGNTIMPGWGAVIGGLVGAIASRGL